MANYPESGNGHSEDHAGFGQRVDHLGATAQQFWSEARGTVGDLTDTLDVRGRVQRNPYGMVLAALGVGYVLGGGLFTPLTARMVRLGMRLAALPLVKDELAAMAGAAMDGFSAATQGGGQSGQPNV